MPRRLLVSVGLVLLVAALSLTPPPADSRRLGFLMVWMPLVDSLGFPYNMDAARFIALGEHPDRLLEKGNGRQSRPAYVATGYVLGSLLRPLLPGTSSAIVTNPTYVAFVTLNFVLLIAAVALWDALFAERRWTFAVLPTALLLVANRVVRDFLWMPHTQMFNVLVPVLTMTTFAWAVRHPRTTAPRLAAIGVLVGGLFLYYGSGVVLVPGIAAGLVAGRRRDGGVGPSLGAQLAALALGFAVLPIVWWVVVVLVAGEFYSAETADFRQFVWMLDAARSVRPLAVVARRLSTFAWITAQIAWFPATLCAAAGVAAFVAGVERRRLVDAHGSLLAAAGVTLALVVVFFAGMGWYNERLEWNVAPPLLAIAAVLLTALAERVSPPARVAIAVVAVAASVGWLGHVMCEPRGEVTTGTAGVRSPACRVLVPFSG